MLTRDQKYAISVHKQVERIKKEEKEYKKYGAMAHKLPILIHTAGLVQALEFVRARKELILLQFLEDLAITVGQDNAQTLLDHARRLQLSKYMLLTQQVLAALLWYKRFAQSILDVEASEGSQD